MNLAPLTTVLALAVSTSSAAAQSPSSVESRLESWALHQEMAEASPMREVPWVAVGPTFQGGRIEAIAWPAQDPDTIYLGIGSGGVFKTTDAGEQWQPIFDEQSTTAIGSIAVAPSDPNIVWVGTGETHPSGTSFPGMGVFKSEDGGTTWRNMGLHDSHHVSALVVHPKDPNIVYVSSMGHHRSNNAERGIFKSTDGGKTWASVLFISDSVATVDLVIDPFDVSTLYASSWDRRGDGSGIYRSIDEGANWTRLTEGLPAGADTGRVAIDVSRSQLIHSRIRIKYFK